ncbi:hypothetical protein AB1399_00145, partial [Hydrogenibacillus schlegelii]
MDDALTAIFIAQAAPLIWILLAHPSEHMAFIVRQWLLAEALTTLSLAGITAGLAAGLGTGLAWLYTAYDFPFRRGLAGWRRFRWRCRRTSRRFYTS